MAPQYALWPAAIWLVCLITAHATESNDVRAQDARAAIDSPDTAPAPPQLAALPQGVPSPLQNPTDPAKVSLGRELFFDRRLSGDNTMSCATCHMPGKAFADGRPTAQGHKDETLSRNTPSVLNVAFLSKFNWDGRAASLEEQALGPITSPEEMNQPLDELVQELGDVTLYAEQFRAVFGTNVTADGIAKALAAFQRTLITEPAPLDRYLAGDKKALSAAAKRGLALFTGTAGCIRCHHGPMLTDQEFYRLRFTAGDIGREQISQTKDDRYRFRTPPLRNIAQTGPYMHDGVFETLFDVVTFYFRGVPTSRLDGLAVDLAPLSGESFSDISDLVAFLESLTGKTPEVEVPEVP